MGVQRLTWRLPGSVRVVAMSPGPAVTLMLTLPLEVADLLAQALEYAGRVTGSERLGAQIAAICQECLGEWQAQHACHEVELQQALVDGVPDLERNG